MKRASIVYSSHAQARTLVAAVAGLVALAVGGCGGGNPPPVTSPPTPIPTVTAPITSHPLRSTRPNIVFVLTDDLSMDLLPFMPHVQEMGRRGLTFTAYFVSDSLCCPSRASIFTGEFPHDTKVLGNFGPQGGFEAFHRRHEESRTFANALQRSGYLTAMMGKYLNGYMGHGAAHTSDGATTNVPATYVPPGWNEWDVAGWGYPEFNYTLNYNGHLQAYGNKPWNYLTDILARKGAAFIGHAAAVGRPFFLELATFAPHSPYVPAPRNANDFPGLRAPRSSSFDVLPSHAPQWLAFHPRLTHGQIARIDRSFRLRAQSVEAVDRMIGEIERVLRLLRLAGNTYIVFSSDNGLHMGQYRLMPGKLTAFDTDIHVPLVVTGPGVHSGTTTPLLAENVDLAGTFAAIGGARFAGDGRSLLPVLKGKPPATWRDAVLIEHRGPRLSKLDPDFQQSASGTPNTYEAMRTHGFLYVEYADGEREFYDLKRDPFELHNIARRLTRGQLTFLHRSLGALERCHGAASCWRAMRLAGRR